MKGDIFFVLIFNLKCIKIVGGYLFELEFFYYIKKIILIFKYFVYFFVYCVVKYLYVRDFKLIVLWFFFMFKDDKKK